MPTLLLLGSDSPAFFRAAVERLNTLIPGSRVHEMPGQQHIAMDTSPDEFIRAVSGFMHEARG